MTRLRRLLQTCVALLIVFSTLAVEGANLRQTIREAQRKVVKIYGAGGLRGMEAYQTGILISAEGHVLTALSYVLDTNDLVVMLDDGRKWQAEFVGSDPVRELAVLRIPVEGGPLPHFDLHQSVKANEGQRVLALSNLYGIATGDEPVSVLQGVVTAIAPLDARRGVHRANYRDTVYVLDAYANNPGASGGALVDWQGRLIGVLGKELRSRVTGTWLNYALPAEKIATVVDDLLAGRELDSLQDEPLPPERALSTEALGFMLVPNVLPRTPPYVDTVRPHSPADKAGLRPDDLVVFVAEEPTASCQALVGALARYEFEEEVRLLVLREGALVEFRLRTAATAPDVDR
ncbi:MAG: serine protease [Planctomycetes bacterium]|nr:serine protease [Planctomycetota bacterium]